MSELDRYELDETFGCHLWRGRVDDDGYPIVWRGRYPVKAYLLAYEAKYGPIPEGKRYHHRCLVRLCINPLHALITTQSHNLQLRTWRARIKEPLCDAKHGKEHAMVTVAGGRLCRLCHRGR